MGSSSLFVGNSAYSQDFSQIIDRTLAIAQLPIIQVEQQKLQIVDQNTAVTTLQGKFESLRIALNDLSSAVGSANVAANFSASGIASASLGENPTAGEWSLDVLSLGTFTNYVTASGAANPSADGIGSELTKTLIVDGVETNLTLASNTLDALATAINASAAGITATIVNVSPTSTPSYKLVLEGDKLRNQSIALKDRDALGADLLEGSPLTAGSNAQYKVNGVAVSAESRSVTIAPGVDLTLSQTSVDTGPVAISVKRSASRIAETLRTVVSTYNAASSALSEHRGKGEGVLKGQSAVNTLSDVLRKLTRHTADSGNFQNFVDLGLSFDDQGVLSLSAEKLAGLSNQQLDDLVGFLGIDSDSGFVANALNTLSAATDADSGILATERASYSNQIKSDDVKILGMRERLQRMETDLRERFATMDSLIASLQQQALYINNLFESMRIASQSYSK